MPPLTYISAFRRTDANGGSRGEAMPERENAKIVNAEQKVARKFGHSKDLITLSLSQVLTYSSSHIIKIRGHPRVNIRFFLQSAKFWSSECKGKLVCTMPSRDKTRPKVKGSLLVICPPLNVKTNIETQ